MPPQGESVRARLLELARDDPGIPVAEAARRLALDASTVSYHARVLARRGRLTQARGGHRSALYATASGPCASVRPALHLLRDPAARTAAWLLLRGPVASLDLHLRAGVTRQRAWRVLRNLADAGLAAREGRGFALNAALAPCLARALQRQRCAGRCPQSRTLMLSPSPSGRMSVSTPGAEEASRLYSRMPRASGVWSSSESAGQR